MGRSHRYQSTDPPDDWVDGSWTVDCVCGVNFDDGEEMVNCDECGVWVHTRCSRYVKGDEIFVCDKCKGKNGSNRNDSEETEVAQLLVELPTKTVRLESGGYGSNGPPPPPRRPFRLWTDIPIEERVHVQGIPGGDPGLFGGLSSVLTPELWKCTGYVPKKFNFQYKEFPCWDEKKEGDSRIEDENENPVDKGAGVLFSLSKERVFASPVAALVGVKGRHGEDSACDTKVASFKDMKTRESEELDARCVQNGGVKKERSLLRTVVVQSSRQKKEDWGTSRDRSRKKKARATEKEVDARKRGSHSSKTAPTSDAKQLEFYEDRGLKFIKDDTRSAKKKDLKAAVVSDHVRDGSLAVDNNIEETNNNLPASKHHSEALPSDLSRCVLSSRAVQKGAKEGQIISTAIGSSQKTVGGVAASIENMDAEVVPVKEEGAGRESDKLENDAEDSATPFVKHPIKNQASYAPVVKENQSPQDYNGDTSVISVQTNVKVKTEDDDVNSRRLLNTHSSPLGDAKDAGVSSDQASENSKVNDPPVSCLQSMDHIQDAERSSEAISDYHLDKGDELSGDACKLDRELDDSEGSGVVKRIPSETKHVLGFAEGRPKSGGTILSSSSQPSQHKMVVSVGKSSSTSSNTIPCKPSTTDNVKTTASQNPDPITIQRAMSDCNVRNKKDRTSGDVIKDEERDDLPKNTVKDRSKSSENSTTKASHSSRISHDSVPKQTVSDSKDPVLQSSSKSTSAQYITPAIGSVESAGSMHHQKSLQAQNKIQASGLPQRGEKFNQTQSLSKMNQSHGTSGHPLPSNSPATLSDEELALLLHQELNSSPRVPRVPRMRNAGSLPQLAPSGATSMLVKRASSSGGKDHSSVSRKKHKDSAKDGFRCSREIDDEAKKMDKVPSSPDLKRQDEVHKVDVSNKREENGSPTALLSVKKNIPTVSTTTTNSGLSSSTEANDRNLSSLRNSPRNTSDDDTGAIGGPVHRTLPGELPVGNIISPLSVSEFSIPIGLINEIMSKGRRMTYEELCNAVLPHWHNLRKHNGERYAYSSHSQAVLDCLRNRHEWAQLVDRGPKTNSSKKRRKSDADESEDNEYGKSRSAKEVECKSLDSQREDFPKGKRKARKRRRLSLQGRGIKDVRRTRKADLLTDDDVGPFSDSSEDSMFSEDEIQGGGACPAGSEASASLDETGTM